MGMLPSAGSNGRQKADTRPFAGARLQAAPSEADPVRQSMAEEKRKQLRQGLQDFIKQQRQVAAKVSAALHARKRAMCAGAVAVA
jgi:hypothetical protein